MRGKREKRIHRTAEEIYDEYAPEAQRKSRWIARVFGLAPGQRYDPKDPSHRLTRESVGLQRLYRLLKRLWVRERRTKPTRREFKRAVGGDLPPPAPKKEKEE